MKDKGYFCPIANNNQFGIGSGISCFRVASEFESRYNNPLEAEAEADEADDAIVADEADAVEADEDDNANEADLANEADEADTEADDAIESIVTKEIKANVITEIVAADEAIVINEVITKL